MLLITDLKPLDLNHGHVRSTGRKRRQTDVAVVGAPIHTYIYIMEFSTGCIYYRYIRLWRKLRWAEKIPRPRSLCFGSTKSDFSFGVMERKNIYSNGNHWPSESFYKTNGLWKKLIIMLTAWGHPVRISYWHHLHIPVTNRFYLSATLESTSSFIKWNHNTMYR